MSSQRTLTEYDAPSPADGQQGAQTSAWTPRGDARCVCGASVDREAARVFGVDGVVPACPACWTTNESKRDIRYGSVTACVVAFNDSRETNHRKAGVEIDASQHPEVSE